MAIESIVLPELGEGVLEGEIVKIKVSQGDVISVDQVLLEVMTDKASMEVPSTISGILREVKVSEGDLVSVGTELFIIEVKGDPADQSENEVSAPQKDLSSQKEDLESMSFSDDRTTEDRDRAIPATRKLAKELGLSLKEISGQGPKGAVRREDLIEHVKTLLENSSAKRAVKLFSPGDEGKREPLRGIKRLMFESMSLSKSTIPHFTIGEEASMDILLQLRKETNLRLEKKGLKTGYLSFFIKALIPVLKEFPLFNSVYDPLKKEIVFRKNYHIGFAVDSPEGLVVPVLKEVQTKSLFQIITEIQDLAKTVREGKAERENLQGASITLSNLGSLGGLYGTPIINPPEVAIVGFYRLFKKVVQNKQGQFEEKSFMNFSITCDHRFIDGATAARFLKSFKDKLEEPSLLILE